MKLRAPSNASVNHCLNAACQIFFTSFERRLLEMPPRVREKKSRFFEELLFLLFLSFNKFFLGLFWKECS